MVKENELLESLLGATSLIDDTVNERISLSEFVERYGNYYYYEALDGHEASSQTRGLFEKYQSLISLHEEVQTKVVDLTYLGPKENEAEFMKSGRISTDSATQKLKELAVKYDLALWLEKLRSAAD